MPQRSAPLPSKVAVIVNAKASTVVAQQDQANLREELERATRAVGIDAAVRICEPDSLSSVLRQDAADETLGEIWVAGGDGTVHTAAQHLVGTDKVLGVLPLGTLNLLAADLGIPREMTEAVGALASATRTRIDAGEVNGHRFVVHSTLGVYPWMVRRREPAKSRAQKLIATWRAGLRAIRSAPRVSVALETREGYYEARTYTLTVTVGHIRPGGKFLEGRGLRDGHLVFHLVRARQRIVLGWLAMRAALGRIEGSSHVDTIEARFARVTSERNRIVLSLDGEILLLDTPLEYRILPQALWVRAPAARRSRDNVPPEKQETLQARA